MDTPTDKTILTFTTLRAPLIILLTIILLNFLILLFFEKKIKVGQLAVLNIVGVFFASLSILTKSGVIVEQFSLVGDPFSFYLVLISSIIFLIAIFMFARKIKKEQKKNK